MPLKGLTGNFRELLRIGKFFIFSAGVSLRFLWLFRSHEFHGSSNAYYLPFFVSMPLHKYLSLLRIHCPYDDEMTLIVLNTVDHYRM